MKIKTRSSTGQLTFLWRKEYDSASEHDETICEYFNPGCQQLLTGIAGDMGIAPCAN
jgi:hypothetical protein